MYKCCNLSLFVIVFNKRVLTTCTLPRLLHLQVGAGGASAEHPLNRCLPYFLRVLPKRGAMR